MSKTDNTKRKDHFLSRAKEAHGTKYDYSRLPTKPFPAMREKHLIGCPKHGSFSQALSSHLQGYGCPACGIETTNAKKLAKADTKKWIRDFKIKGKKIHGDKYDYSKIHYTTREKTTLSCPIHGEFSQTYGNHITLKHGCPSCGVSRMKESKHEVQGTPKEKYKKFIKISSKVHKGKYDYSLVPKELPTLSMRVTVICSKHGEFITLGSNHIKGHDCMKCSALGLASKGETALADYIQRLVPDTLVLRNDRTAVDSSTELDIYIPELNLAFEYCGLYWHSEKFKDKNYHKIKTDACSENGIQLITVFENEWVVTGKRKIVKSRIKSLLGVTPNRIYARKCEVKEVSYQRSKRFLENNHLQGNCVSKIRLGLYHEKKLVALCTFGKPRFNKEHDWELLRSCFLRNTSVVGGTSKLLKAFERYLNLSIGNTVKLLSYADRRWSRGNVYSVTGFDLIRTTDPAAWFTWRGRAHILKHRMGLQKHKLPVILDDYDPELSALDNLRANGYTRIHDCGNLVFSKTLEEAA